MSNHKDKKGSCTSRIAHNHIKALCEFIFTSMRGLLTSIISLLVLYGIGSSTIHSFLAWTVISTLAFNLATCLFPQLGDRFGTELRRKQSPLWEKVTIAILLSLLPPLTSGVGKVMIPSLEGGVLQLLPPSHQYMVIAAIAAILLLSNFFADVIYILIKNDEKIPEHHTRK